jgi:hypothetical protein
MGFGSGGGSNFGSGRSDLDSDLTIDGSVKIKEGSAADADIAGQGQLWVKSDAPNNLYFTDDTGQDVQITSNGALAGVAGSLSGLGSTDNVILRSSGTGGETAQGSGVLIDDSNNFTIPTTAKIQFRDSALFINSSTDGQLDIDADVEVEITAPTVNIAASTTLLLASPALRLFSGTSAAPLVTIENTNADATGGTLKFLKNGASVADDDVVGNITFVSEDDGDNSHTYASIIGSIADMTGGAEGGRLELKVAEHDGTVTTGFKLQDGNADGEIDVTVGAGASSVTTIAGTLTMGSTAAMTNAGLLSVADQSNITGVGALASGTIAAGFGAIDNGTSGIRTNTFTAETSIVPDASGGADIGSTSAEWGDVYLADEKAIKFGNDQEITLTHVQDTGLILASAVSATPVFTLKTTNTTKTTSGELQFLKDAADTEDGEVLGKITFFGEDEGNNNTQFAGIVASISESDETDEAGTLELQVAESDGTNTAMTTGLKLEGEHATDGQIDVTIAAGAASTTTIAGTLTMGSTAAMTNAGLLSVGNQSNITGTGALNSGTITSGFGNVDIGSSSLAAGSLDVSDGNITNVGDIDCDSISVADAANGLQIDASAANTGTAAIVLRDNMAQAFAVVEAGNTYMGFTTTDGSESITIAKDLLVTSDTTTFSSANSADPLVIIKNTTNDANGARLQLVKDKGAAGAANDENGAIQFIGDDANQDQVTFSEIKSQVKVHTNGQEGGKLSLQVASHDGTLAQGLLIEDGDASGELDVTIGAGASSVTQIAGTLDLGDRNITNVGDIDLDKISVADAASGLLIDASGANTGTAAVILGDNLAQAFAVVETSGGSVTYMGFATTNGSELVTIAKPLEIANGSSNGATALLVDNDDTDQIALHIEAANIDADVIQIDADAVTTAHVIDITADALTTGAVLNVGALGKNPIILDHNYTDSSAATIKCMQIDFDKSGGGGTDNTVHGIDIDMDCTDMSGGTNVMKGIVLTPRLINASGTGAATVMGMDITATGGTQGNGTISRGINIVSTGADFCQGIHLKSGVTGTPDSVVGNHLKLISSASDNDTFQVSVLNNGETVLKTVDSGDSGNDTDAHIHVIADGNIEMSTAAAGQLKFRTSAETAAGAGADAGSVVTSHNNVNGQFTTTIQLDITGLKSKDAADKIIGEAGGGAAYLTKLETAKTGRIYRIEMICIEAPTTGEVDIDLIASTANNLEYDSAEGTNDLLVDANGDWTLGRLKDNFTIGSTDLNNKYVYLSVGTAASPTEGVYDNGKYLIIFHGA